MSLSYTIEIKREDAELLIKGVASKLEIYSDKDLEVILFALFAGKFNYFNYSVVQEHTGKMPTYWDNRFAFTQPPSDEY